MFYITDNKKAQYVHNLIAILYNTHALHFAAEAKMNEVSCQGHTISSYKKISIRVSPNICLSQNKVALFPK